MEEKLYEIEQKDGVRINYNILPTRSLDILPISILYTPYNPAPLCEYEPVFCFTCRSILNPMVDINYGTKTWTCTFCKKTNHLPDYYKDIQPEYLPLEMLETTVEYKLSKDSAYPPVFVLLIDTCTFDNERHDLLKEAVKTTLENLPRDCLISIIHFGTNIELFVNSSDIKKTYLFSGKKEYTPESLKEILNKNTEKGSMSCNSKFFYNIEDLNYDPLSIRKDPFPVMNGMRPLRCTGSAISFAQSLIDFKETGCKIFLFTQGPCTFGPGTISSLFLKDGIRSHSDIIKGKASYTSPAAKFYSTLAEKMAHRGIACDLIAATIEDIGVYEMRPLFDFTGGVIIMAQDFDKEIYLSSIKKNLEDFALFGQMKVTTSSNLNYKSVLGHGCKANQGWIINKLNKNLNLSIIVEPLNAKVGEEGHVQIVTRYQKGRSFYIKVTTLARFFDENNEKISLGFDQEAAFILQARMYTFSNKFEEDLDLVRRIDRGLIRFVKKYATYTRDDPTSVILPDSMSFYPKFTYFLRRSVVVQSETNSPDETSYFRYILARERIINAMTMIVPVLTEYHYVDGLRPVEMDSQSIRPDSILLLDAFSNVLIWKGEHIMQWIKEEYHLKEEFVSLKNCIDESLKAALDIYNERLPTPQFVETYAGGSQERTLLSRVNPSRQGAEILTEDIDFDSFYRFLCKIIVEA